MTNPMMPNEASIVFAERLRSHMPYLERLRFTNTGSEATRSAVRVARATTGRTKIAKFEGNFHGSDDAFLVSTHSHRTAGTDARPEPQLDYAGLAPRLLDEVVVLPYNNARAACEVIGEHASELAAVIMEPVAFSSGGGVPATPEFAAAIRELTAANDIPLIFDEVLCALRLGLAGAPSYLGVVPDLATIGKAVGGGMPLAAFGGRVELMEAALGADAGDRKVFQSGTFTENPVSIAAGMAVLDVLETTPALEQADAAGAQLRSGLAEVFDSAGLEVAVSGAASIVQMHWGAPAINNRRDILSSDTERTREFLLRMVAHRVLWPPLHPGLTSAAHGPEEVEAVLAAARAAVEEMR
jgi:glutamate-1-semialdehyde 2,1-aminomutase